MGIYDVPGSAKHEILAMDVLAEIGLPRDTPLSVNAKNVLTSIWHYCDDRRMLHLIVARMGEIEVPNLEWVGIDTRIGHIADALLNDRELYVKYVQSSNNFREYRPLSNTQMVKLRIVVLYALLTGKGDVLTEFDNTDFGTIPVRGMMELIRFMGDYINEYDENSLPFSWKYKLSGFGLEQNAANPALELRSGKIDTLPSPW